MKSSDRFSWIWGLLLVAWIVVSFIVSPPPRAEASGQYMDSDYRRDEIEARRGEVRALEKIAAQLDRINDTLKECRR